MAASTALVSVDEYIQHYINGGAKPACEYVDGVLIPKPLGNRKHSRTQVRLTVLLNERFRQFEVLTEIHARLRTGQFYIPDVAVERRGSGTGDYPGPDSPVHLCIEIVSPGQGVGQLLGKCEEYHRWGVLFCWVIDPERETAWEYPRGGEPQRVTVLRAGEIELSLEEILAGI